MSLVRFWISETNSASIGSSSPQDGAGDQHLVSTCPADSEPCLQSRCPSGSNCALRLLNFRAVSAATCANFSSKPVRRLLSSSAKAGKAVASLLGKYGGAAKSTASLLNTR